MHLLAAPFASFRWSSRLPAPVIGSSVLVKTIRPAGNTFRFKTVSTRSAATSKMPQETPSVFPAPSLVFQKFASRRSVVHSTKGIVACTQPLAAKCGIDILNAGGNAAVSSQCQ
jgi:hypothetical protein